MSGNESAAGGTMRLFVALEIPPELKDALSAYGRTAGPKPSGAKWVAKGNMHVTLAFIGDLDAKDLPDVKRALESAATDSPAFEARIFGTGGFPKAKTARIFWAGIEPGARIAALAQAVRSSLRARGIPFDPKPCAPHVTLARLPERTDVGAFAKLPELVPFVVREIELFSSVLAREGPHYSVEGRFHLRADE